MNFLANHVLGDNPTINFDEPILAAYQMSHMLYTIESYDFSQGAEELEVNYFLSKYRSELGLNTAADDHKTNFWTFASKYQKGMDFLSGAANGSYFLPYYTQRYISEGLPLKVGQMERPYYYRNIWANGIALATAYPKHLLGVENNPAPGTMMYQFIRDIGTRAQTSP